jgi:hypothetical protein
MADLTPIEEYNKKLRESSRELEKQTGSLRTPFKQLISEVQNVNAEFAKVAADNIGETQNTWKGLITQSKKKALIEEQLNNKEVQARTKAVENQQRRQAELETRKKQLEEKFIGDKEALLARDTYGKNSLTKLNEKKLELEEKYNNSNSNQRAKIATELESLAGTINTRESSLSKVIESEKDREIESIDNSIKEGQESSVRNQIAIDEANEKFTQSLEDAGKTENYDKFTGAVKTLTGGIVDIEGILDPVANVYGAFRDLGDVAGNIAGKVFGPMEKGLQTVGKKLFGEKDSLSENLEDIGDTAKESVMDGKKSIKIGKKEHKSRMGWLGKLGMGTIMLGAFLAAVVLLYNKFEKFADWVDRFMGWNRPEDQKDAMVETTDEFTEGLEDNKVSQGEIDDYKDETDKQIALQEDSVEYEEGREDIKMAENAAQVARTTIANAPKVQSGVVRNFVGGVTETAKNLSNNVDDGLKGTKIAANAGKDVLKTAGKTTMGLMKMTSRGLLPVSMLLTGVEIAANLKESKDIEKTIEAMWDSGEMAEEDYRAAKDALDNKRKQDVRKPWWQTGVGAFVATAVGVALTATGVGAPLGLAIVATTAAGASYAAGKVVDAKYDGDEILEEMGLLQTADSANANLDDMVDLQKGTIDKANMILDANNDINDIESAGSAAGNVIASSSNIDNSQTISTSGTTPPVDPNQRAVNE